MRGAREISDRIRVAIVSDTHAHLDPRIAELVEDCDIAVHAGDIGCAGVLRALRPRTGQVLAVAGNNDSPERWPSDDAEVAEKLPKSVELDLPGGRLVVEHGERHGFQTPCHNSLRNAHPRARAIVYGHTHRLVCDRSDAPWVLNPGAAGQTRTRGGPSCLVLTAWAEHEWTVVPRRFPSS